KTRYRPWNQVIQSPFIVLSDYPSLVACCAKTNFLRSPAKNGSQDRFFNALTPPRTSCVTRAILVLALWAVVVTLQRSNLFPKDLSRKAALLPIPGGLLREDQLLAFAC
ncbi:hypothetical protein, partial [Gallaecimonas pentaromativorans]|uniref:hypothetical protein n=1 Tax=Gallaecimonas pentaromativorans TaxID=584787 RepID=UPI003A9565F8